ncbi:MAG: PP2C family protein-serine/threonine phosphatase [Lachnospiraceae bacterium]
MKNLLFGFRKKKKQEEFYYEGEEQNISFSQEIKSKEMMDASFMSPNSTDFSCEQLEEKDIVTVKIFPEDEKERQEKELNICFSSIIGSRDYQQDSLEYRLREDEFLGAVCDGMGGMSGGELASQLAIKILMEQFDNAPYPISNIPLFLYQAAKKMDLAVADLEDETGKPIQGGTTVVAVYIYKNKLYYMSVGDSKIYLIRNKKMVSITREHNYKLVLDQSLREKAISIEEYEEEIKRGEALISYLGMGNIKLIDINQNPFSLQKGDMVLLCSDGLYKSFSDREIQDILELGSEKFEQLATILTETVLKYGKKPLDNCSILLVKYQGEQDGR